MSIVVGGVVCQRSEGESVLVEVLGLPEQVDHEVATAHKMRQIGEKLAAERVVAHVLYERAAVSKGVGFFQIIGGGVGKSLGEEWCNVILPKQIDDFLVREHGVSTANLRQSEEQPETHHRAIQVEKSCHKRRSSLSST